jgi:hypothetical protein
MRQTARNAGAAVSRRAIVKHRSLTERLFGKKKMTVDDECAAFFRQLIEGEPGFAHFAVE